MATPSETTLIDEHARAQALAADVREGLTSSPKTLPPKYFYDATGSELFDEITRLPEYYPTRTERAILADRAEEIAELTQPDTLVEIGSGTSEKTRLLLSALRGSLQRFVPFDVDPAVLGEASSAINREFPAIDVEPVVGDFEQHLHLLPRGGRRLIAFLGSTIGNLEPAARIRFLGDVRATMSSNDAFLLGTDLVKPAARLVAAYDDSAGVTAQFNKNVLRVVNRELGADFDIGSFDHVAVWDPRNEWIEMRLRSSRDQTVHIAALAMDVVFLRDEQMRTEISAKFRRERVADELNRAGLRLTQWWTDPAADFALSLAVPADLP